MVENGSAQNELILLVTFSIAPLLPLTYHASSYFEVTGLDSQRRFSFFSPSAITN